ncbi:carboxypeptidase-like regulatory domain-containing protein [Paraflavitalea speifideaquila]|uniref:carboxypeptidase-like regulatory domain-containing protein n=1 Tax=Paraflavitalea speifideaquila TaxID=3076558 RepID=UPI0028E3145A|nr:carboxypeptidase-like regulatory domain-containing protein [Paraflavitalea speifideiaquila]
MAVMSICLGIPAWAQVRFPGTVLDTAMHPVHGATLHISNQWVKTTTTSNTEGAFVFEHLAPGSYAITVTAIGYELFTSSINLTDSLAKTSYLVKLFLQSRNCKRWKYWGVVPPAIPAPIHLLPPKWLR